MRNTTILAASGQLGTGFLPETLNQAMAMKPDMIGCDAGSTDGGPYFLGSGVPKSGRDAVARDLGLMLRAARGADIPMLIGSAGTGGAKAHLAVVREILLDVACEARLNFRLATIDSQIDKAVLLAAHAEGRIHPLKPWTHVPVEAIDSCDPIVAQIGVEHFAEALRQGADVVLAGRATDAAIYATVPEMRGMPLGPTWHASKVLECGAACVRHRSHPDCMVATIDEHGFTVRPPNPEHSCSAQSVAAQTLYENANAFQITEPSGVLDTSECSYVMSGERNVRVTGSRFLQEKPYDLKLEGARFVGYRAVAIGSVRDPYVIRGIDRFVSGSVETIRKKIRHSLGLEEGGDYTLDFRTYGKDGTLGDMEPSRLTPDNLPFEMAVVISVIAGSRDLARDISAIAWHTALHYSIPEWSGLVSNLAFPFSPPHMDAGPVYEFGLNALYRPAESPLEICDIRLEQVGGA